MFPAVERGSDWDRQWREDRRRRDRGRGRGFRGGWRGEGGWRGKPPTGGWQGEGEEEKEEEGGVEGEDDPRLLSSLIDPQEVPRKGFFYEVQPISFNHEVTPDP